MTTLRQHIGAILDDEIPGEYRKLQDQKARQVREALFAHPSQTVLLHGAPGTGKTALAWVLLRSWRAGELMAHYGADEDRTRLDLEIETTPESQIYNDGQGATIPGTIRLAGVSKVFALTPTPQSASLITEPGDILRHRFDRGWLDRTACFAGVLIVDDLGSVPTSDWVVETLYHLSNHRRAWGLATIYSSNWPPAEIGRRLTHAIASRICGGELFEVRGQDRRQA